MGNRPLLTSYSAFKKASTHFLAGYHFPPWYWRSHLSGVTFSFSILSPVTRALQNDPTHSLEVERPNWLKSQKLTQPSFWIRHISIEKAFTIWNVTKLLSQITSHRHYAHQKSTSSPMPVQSYETRRGKIIMPIRFGIYKCTFGAWINLRFTGPTVLVRNSWHVESCTALSYGEKYLLHKSEWGVSQQLLRWKASTKENYLQANWIL